MNMRVLSVALLSTGFAGCGLAMTNFDFRDVSSESSSETVDSDTLSVFDSSSESVEPEDTETLPIEWISLPGGVFELGSQWGTSISFESPIVEVQVSAFEILRTEVTVAQYRQCVEAGTCAAPRPWTNCGVYAASLSPLLLETKSYYANYDNDGRANHPVNCVSFSDAEVFCEWVGGMLPSEAQWEFAAQSGQRERKFPWGDELPECGIHAVFYPMVNPGFAAAKPPGCGLDRTFRVCSTTEGMTDQGLCDMGGNVAEWVLDKYHKGYGGYPHADSGEAWLDEGGTNRVIRGGGFNSIWGANTTRTGWRFPWEPDVTDYGIGFRCVKSTAQDGGK